MTHSGITPLTRDAGTEGSLLIPKTIYNTLIEAAKKKLLPRELAAIYVGPNGIPGSSVDLNLVTADSMKVFRVAEGAVIPIDTPAYSSTNLKPIKYGVRPFITKEMIEDGKWDLLEHSIRTAGTEIAENENDLIETVLDGASNAVSAGATVTIADITRAMQYIEDADYTPTDLIVTAEIMNDLRNLDLLVEAQKFGSNELLRRGYVGNIYGLRVWVVGSSWTSTKAYVIDRDNAFAIAEKRPVSVERYNRLEDDMVGAVVTTRIVVKELRNSAIAEITSS